MDDARRALAATFGYADFRAPQVPAIDAVLSRRDAVIVLPTGGGKSICFQVPALLFPRLTVVVSPLISLMADQVQALERRGIGATFLNSTLSPDETHRRVEWIRAGQVKLLYVAPERLAVGTTTTLLASVGVDVLAIDEAHCVSEWGQDFRPSYLRLATVRASLGGPQTIALTATATPRVRRDIARLLALRNPVEVVGGFDRPNLTFRVQAVKSDAERNQVMIAQLRAVADPAVVYAATRRQVDQVTRWLVAGRVNAVGYHAGLAADKRSRAQDAFMNGSTRVIVATNAFGMGIDKPDVRLVLHYLHSRSLEDYYQEAGRAGRDGARSRCVLLFNENDRQVHERMRVGAYVPAHLIRRTWEFLARLSAGRRAVPADPRLIANALVADAGRIDRALQLLRERNVIPGGQQVRSIRLRVLASPLRLECERGALSMAAGTLLGRVLGSPMDPCEWRAVAVADCGLSAWQLDAGLAELESRQLVFVDREAPRVVVASDTGARRRLEQTLHDLDKRREVEHAKLNAMVGYASASMCRRRYILEYFGDAVARERCGDCDVCIKEN